MNVTDAMVIATGLTAIRVFGERFLPPDMVSPLPRSEQLELERQGLPVPMVEAPGESVAGTVGKVSTVIIGGTLATAVLLIAEEFSPLLARQFSVLVLLTSVLVNGVGLADIIRKVLSQ